MLDGYGAYDALARGTAGCVLAHCWAHVRRKYVEIAEHFPVACATILELIGALYEVEREAQRQAGGDPEALLDRGDVSGIFDSLAARRVDIETQRPAATDPQRVYAA